MADRNYYVFCDDNCRFPAMTAEQVLEAIAAATGNTATPVDDAFITKIKEQNKGGELKFWKGTRAEYNENPPSPDTICFIDVTEIEPAVPQTRKINGHMLNEDITITPEEMDTYGKDTIDSKVADAKKAGTDAQATATAAQSSATAAQTTANNAMPKSGGSFTGNSAAYNTNRTGGNLRNIWTRNSAGADVSSNSIVMHRK